MKNSHKTAQQVSQSEGRKTTTVLSAEQQMKIRGGVPPRSPSSKKVRGPK